MIKTFRFDTDRNEFSANTYVVGEPGGRCVVIDLGSTQDRVIEFIKNNFSSCSGILLTHGHYDHIRGIKKFLENFNCTIFVHQDEKEVLENPKLNMSHYSEKEDISYNYSNMYLYDDEDEIDFKNGYIFKVIATPFHTLGSSCFLCEKENALFTGDTLFKDSIGRTDLPLGNERLINRSLSKLLLLDDNLKVYPGHGDETTLKREKEKNLFLSKIERKWYERYRIKTR